MSDSLAGIALGAGAGERLRPLTDELPKVLCPVAQVPLIDGALDRLRTVTDALAVNAHHTQPELIEHLEGRVHVSVETEEALGTAGALGQLREWIDGRPTVVVNGDTWCPGDLRTLVDGWDGNSIRLLVPGGGPFGPRSPVAGALMSWADVEALQPTPTGLWEVSWREALRQGRVEAVAHRGHFVDCADAADYLAANLAAAGGSVIPDDAVVEGSVDECVLWPGARVERHERLRRAIRTGSGLTVEVAGPLPAVRVSGAGV